MTPLEWLLILVLGLIAVIALATMAWFELEDWRISRRENRLEAELDAATAELERTEQEIRTRLRLGSLEARKLLIRASYDYANRHHQRRD
jgi:hypothetical protein